MRIALATRPLNDQNLILARQIGVTDIVTHYPGPGFEPLKKVRDTIASFGMRLSVIENEVSMVDIINDGPKRDEQLAEVIAMIGNMGKLDIPVWCYAWTPNVDWSRTSVSVPERGGSLVSQFDFAEVENAKTLGVFSEIEQGDRPPATSEKLWGTLEGFLEQVLPIAESVGVALAIHPDDPPMTPFRGDEQIMTCPDDFQRLVDLIPHPTNGLTFCQGCFSSMGVDVVENIHRFRDHIQFVHFRDVKGRVPKFTESWHDNGQTDMAAAIRAYREIGFDGPMRPDHVPVLEGESTEFAGYTMLGRLWAVGYMKGLIEASE